MLKPPSSPIIIPVAPVTIALPFGATYTVGPPDSITINPSSRLYLPNTSWDGIGSAFYAGKKIALRVNTDVELESGAHSYFSSLFTDLNDGVQWQMNIDGNGIYVRASSITLWSGTFASAFVTGFVYASMVYPENSYPDFTSAPHTLPPAFSGTPIST